MKTNLYASACDKPCKNDDSIKAGIKYCLYCVCLKISNINLNNVPPNFTALIILKLDSKLFFSELM